VHVYAHTAYILRIAEGLTPILAAPHSLLMVSSIFSPFEQTKL